MLRAHLLGQLHVQLQALRVALLVGLTCLLVNAQLSGRATAADASTIAADSAIAAPRVLVLGDSISAAYGMSLEQGWAALLQLQLQERWSKSQVVNASISGDTSAGGLRRLPDLLTKHAPDVVVIELGGNDGLRGYPTGKLKNNLTTMAQLARNSGADVLILPMEIPPNYGPRYTRSFRESFQAAAKETQSTLGPFLLEGIATKSELMQQDGIHPTVAAQPLITELVAPVIESLLAERLAL